MIELLISPTAQPIDEPILWLIEAELQRLGVGILAGYSLPLEPDHAARLLVRALGGPGSGRYPKGSGQNPQSGKLPAVVKVGNLSQQNYQRFTSNLKANLHQDLDSIFESRSDSHVSVTATDANDEEIRIRVDGTNAYGEETHHADLVLREEGLWIDTIEVSPEHRSSNIAVEMLRDVHQLAEKTGTKEIQFTASSSHGAYAWAKIGGTTVNSQEAFNLATVVRNYYSDTDVEGDSFAPFGFDGATAASLDALLKKNKTNPKLPWLLASFRSADGKLLGPSILRGRTWDGRFDMKDPEAQAKFDRLVYRKNR